MSEAVVVEADGGSRGNPGPAAYGTVLKDATSGEVLAEDGVTIGVATNNVAEYQGLLGGLRLAERYAPGARIEVRMDSRLVVEQMSGRWRVKHPALRPLAAQAADLAPPGTTYTWVPRARNAHADRLANDALDGVRDGVTLPERSADVASKSQPKPEAEALRDRSAAVEPTTVVLVRHGVTAMTAAKRFSGGLGGSNPGLIEEGRAQVRATAEWLRPAAGRLGVVMASPVRRTRESADVIAELLGLRVVEEPGFAEMEFGAWDELSFAEVGDQHGADLDAWLGSLDVRAGGAAGESMREVQDRVLRALRGVLERYPGQTVLAVSHVTPIKVLVADALGAPLESVYRMELSPASVTVVSYYPAVAGHDAHASLRLFNARPPGVDAVAAGPGRW